MYPYRAGVNSPKVPSKRTNSYARSKVPFSKDLTALTRSASSMTLNHLVTIAKQLERWHKGSSFQWLAANQPMKSKDISPQTVLISRIKRIRLRDSTRCLCLSDTCRPRIRPEMFRLWHHQGRRFSQSCLSTMKWLEGACRLLTLLPDQIHTRSTRSWCQSKNL